MPAGDATDAAGDFNSAADLLAAMGTARTHFDRIRITGYPESHHLIPDDETIRAMFAKSEMATDIISQLCFDADTIAGWIANVPHAGRISRFGLAYPAAWTTRSWCGSR